jgi:hypothetical protein
MDAIDMDLYGNNGDDVEEDKTMTEVNSRPNTTIEEDKDDDSMDEDDDLYMSAPPQVVPQSDELIDESNVSNLGGLGEDTASTMWCQIYCTDGSLKVCVFVSRVECQTSIVIRWLIHSFPDLCFTYL